MNTPRIVASLRAGEPEAIAALFDAHAAELFGYSWFVLRSREAAQVAVRDTLVVAAAHVGALHEPAQLRQWLFCLARGECARRRPVPAPSADEPPARPSQPDADGRVLAWNAVTSMPAASAEILQLTTRHGMSLADTALILGRTQAEATELLETARNEMVGFLGAHLITRRVGFDCAGLTEATRGWAGVMTPSVRDSVLAHARGCGVCCQYLPTSVSPARVHDLLPQPAPHETMRDEVLSWFADVRYAGYRNFAAVRAAGAAIAAAAPSTSDAVPAHANVTQELPAVIAAPRSLEARGRRRRRPGGRIIAGLAAACVAAGLAALFMFAGFPGSVPTPTGAPSAADTPSGPGATGPVIRPGVAAAVPVGRHRSRTGNPAADPSTGLVQALYRSASQRSAQQPPPSPQKPPGAPGTDDDPVSTPSPSPSISWQRGGGGSGSPTPSATPTPTPSPTATSPTPTPTASPSATPSASPSASPTASPSGS